jgi:type IV pilus assembly protein PilE
MKKTYGFTLIELMIVLVVIGILVAVAYPSYQNSVRKTGRSEAKAELMDVAAKLQRCYSLYGRYNDSSNNCKVYELMEAGDITSSGEGLYSVDFGTGATGVTSSTYVLTATAVKLPQTKDEGCEVLKLTHTGVKSPTECW